MINLKDKTIAEIVSEDIRTASVFKKYQLDFCCGGGITVEKACKKASINLEAVLKDLENDRLSSRNVSHSFNEWKVDFLIDYIINVHHSYILENIGIINEFAMKVASVHGHHAPETIRISKLFSELTIELKSHLNKEEQLLFPAIKNKIKNSDQEIDKEVLAMLEDEHDQAGSIIKEIQRLSNNFMPPDWACNTYKALYHKLDEFINDLYQHIHLENNILFQKIKE